MKLARLALLGALALGPAIIAAEPNEALAQGADPVKDVARQRFQDGVKAFDAGRFEEARTAFEQAYTLSQSSAVLLNLGLAEAKTNRCVVGGNHLTKFLREHKDATPEQKTTANAAIEDCKKKVGFISITVDAPNADLTVDGNAVGKSPLAEPVFVEPGQHAVIATLNGKTSSVSVDAKKGQNAVATIAIKAIAEPAPVGPQPTEPGTQPAPVIPAGPNPNPLAPAPLPPPTAPVRDTGEREDFGDWVTSSPLFWVGSGVFAVGLGLGIGFSVAASSSADDAESIASQLRSRAQNDGVDGSPCGPEDSSGSGDIYPSQCNQLRDALDIHDANVAVAAVGWVLAAVGAGGTVAYVMVDWYGGKKKTSDQAKTNVVAVPVVTQDVQGIAVMGRF
ncbi:MAG: hypothetical protein HOW73_38760 [Polyangiaceae bacterium]|nr:hypothetical protein [Polyangiaceae bacterium]